MIHLSYRTGIAATLVMSLLPQSHAQDATIDEEETASVSTTQRLGQGPATLTITSEGSINVTQGTALRIDGPHTLDLSGALISSAERDATGLLIDASGQAINADLTLSGSMTVGNSDSDTRDLSISSLNVGIDIAGGEGFFGDITASGSNRVTVYGSDATGMRIGTGFNGDIVIDGALSVIGNRGIGLDIQAPVTGDIRLDGTVSANDLDSIGVRVGGPVTGAVTVAGTVSIGTAPQVDGDGNNVDGISGLAGLLVEQDITGGLLLEGVGRNNTGVDEDGERFGPTTDSVINSRGSGTAFLLENRKADTSDLVIGLVNETDYGLIMRGTVSATPSDPGVDTLAARLTGGDDGRLTRVEGGIWLDTGIIDAESLDANATGLILGNGFSTPILFNDGRIQGETLRSAQLNDDGETVFGPGGSAFGLLIEETASLPELDNRGSIIAIAAGDDSSAVALRDQSGTLTEIINRGTIAAIIQEDGTGSATAIDLGASDADLRLVNNGTIIGDIFLGSGDDRVRFANGSHEGRLDFGTGNDTLVLRGETELEAVVSSSGTLHLDAAETSLTLPASQRLTATTGFFGTDTTIEFQLNPRSGESSQLVFTDTLTLTDTVVIRPTLNSLSLDQQSFILIDAGTIAGAGDITEFVEIDALPFLFNVDFSQETVDRTQLVLDVELKTAEELGLDANFTTLYNALTTEDILEERLDEAFATVADETAANIALTSLLPDLTNASFDLEVERLRVHEQNISNRLRTFVTDPAYESGFWARETISLSDVSDANSLLDGDILNIDLSLGYDRSISDSLAVGLSGTFTLAGFSRDEELGSGLSRIGGAVSAYGMWRNGGLYAGVDVGAAFATTERERQTVVQSQERLSEADNTLFSAHATAEVGYDLKVGGLHLAPFGRVTTMIANEGSYTEEGTNALNYSVESRDMTYIAATYGAYAGYDIKWDANNILRPMVFAQRTDQLNSDTLDPIIATVVDTDETLTFNAELLDGESESFGGGFFLFGGAYSSYIGYRQDKFDTRTIHSGTINFRLEF